MPDFQSYLEAILAPIVRKAVEDVLVELDEAKPLPPALLKTSQLVQALQISTATLHRLRHEGMPVVWLLDSPRYQLDAVLAWLKERKPSR